MRDWPHGVTGTRNEHLLAALEVVERERDVQPDERHAFREGFIAGWQERGIDDHRRDRASITRDQLNALRADVAREIGARERALIAWADGLALAVGEVLDSPQTDDGRTSVRKEHVDALRAAFGASSPS